MTQSASRRQSGFAAHPGYRVDFEPASGRVTVTLGGVAIADSARAMVLRETGHDPVYYFPREDVRMDLMVPSAHSTFCPFKGDASYWTIEAGGRRAENAMWSYEDPFEEVAAIRNYVAFYPDRVDAITAEDA